MEGNTLACLWLISLILVIIGYSRSPRDLNCLQTVECISGVSTRGNHLRSAISYQILLNCFDNKVLMFISVNSSIKFIQFTVYTCWFFCWGISKLFSSFLSSMAQVTFDYIISVHYLPVIIINVFKCYSFTMILIGFA
jgi:hypothetical protein